MLTRGTSSNFLGILFAFCVCSSVEATDEAGRASKPNIIFIMADDLGYGDLRCYGQERIKTPRLDRMSREGMRFTNCYAGSTVCAPSRCVLMTGLHTGRCRIRTNQRIPLEPEDLTVAEWLQRAGYTTALIGKWGLGLQGTTGTPNKKGFDYFYGYLDQGRAHNYYTDYLWRNDAKVPLRNEVVPAKRNSGSAATKRVDYSPDLMIDECLSFITRNQDKPFFLYYATTIPHANNESYLLDRHGMEVPDYGQYADLDWPEAQKGHAAMITLLDTHVGQILDLLSKLELDDSTIVFFTSDNGPHAEGENDPDFNDSNGPLRGIKRDLYEGGIRVPMIVRWPKHVPAGRTSDLVWYFADFLPTAGELAGRPVSRDIDGVSIVPSLLGEEQELDDRTLYWEFDRYRMGLLQAARRGKWKVVKPGDDAEWELYDLSEDIGEEQNVAADHPDVAAKFKQFLETAREP